MGGKDAGEVVAGGYGRGAGLHQLNRPRALAFDSSGAVLVADEGNHRVVRWQRGSNTGEVIAGGNGCGNGLHQLHYPRALGVDGAGAVLVGDEANHRVMRWAVG